MERKEAFSVVHPTNSMLTGKPIRVKAELKDVGEVAVLTLTMNDHEWLRIPMVDVGSEYAPVGDVETTPSDEDL